MYKYLIICFIGLLIINCTDFTTKHPLPTAISSYKSFGANDTTYIRLSPDWDAATVGYSFSQPMDIVIGRDGYIFVADHGNDKVVVLNKSGYIQTNYNNITDIEGLLGIDIDSKLNLFIVNGTNRIYYWNQYLNYAQIDSVIIQYVLRDTVTDEQFIYTFSELLQAEDDTTHHLILEDYILSGEQALVDSLMNVSIFYEDPSEEAQYMGVAVGPYGKGYIYVTDAGRNRILKIDIVPNNIVLLKNGWLGYTYIGEYNRVVASHGSGAGTVDSPHAITTDEQGDIYFTQTGGNFLVQKLSYKDFNSVFTLNEHPIMDLKDPPLFVYPSDVAVDKESFIYVVEKKPYTLIKTNPDSSVDTTFCYVHKFTPDGRIVDLGNKGIATAVFQNPQGIAVDDEDIIYIANTELNQIERFKLSISDEDLPSEP
ncbi:MAG: NHL repeat-containing protein [bacterium]|nr:MAG: NHL repeat-containing protein [bacterium]